MSSIIVLGSSRNDGNSAALANFIISKTNWNLIDLNDYRISYYDYQHRNRNDDFLEVIEEIIKDYDHIVFITPVYWYSMSGIMKVFFDRLSDLLTIEKELGRKLRGKNMMVFTTSNGNNLGEEFWLPFKESAKYLGMNLKGYMHIVNGEEFESELENYLELIR